MPNRPTKQRIAEEFYALTQKKEIDKITVKDVVDVCGISRQTFYYHFRDLPDVMEWTAEQLVQQAMTESIAYEDFTSAMENFLTQFQKHSRLVHSIIQSNHRNEGEQILINAIHQLVERMLRDRFADQPIAMQDFELIAQYHTYGLAGILIQATGRPNFDPHQLAQQFSRIMKHIDQKLLD